MKKSAVCRSLAHVMLALSLVLMNFSGLYANDVSAEAEQITAEDLFISEYIEGSSYNKALEIYNGTGEAVDLADYRLELYSNGAGSPSQHVDLSGELEHGEVFVIAHGNAAEEILDMADLIHSTVVNFNGDDAVALVKGEELLDTFGEIGVQADFAKDVTRVRQSHVTSPNTAYDTAEWQDYAKDTFAYLGNHTMDGVDPDEPEEPEEPGELQSIADARELSDGTAVTVEGVVTVSNDALRVGAQFTTYVQDETGGINVFAYEQKNLPNVEKGDKIKVAGTLDTYNGLKELIPTSIEVIEQDQELPEPIEISLSELQDEATAESLEGQLVQLNGYINNVPDTPAGGGYNVSIIDADFNGTILRVMENALDISQVPSGYWYDVTGIVSQYNSYQLIPTEQADIQTADEQPDPPSAEGIYESTVERITDGDTIHLRDPVLGGTKVRFLNMDTAETYTAHNKDPERAEINANQKYFGDLAADYIGTLIEPGDEVLVKIGQEPTDDYGRLLAEIIRKEDGMNINLEMVRQGMAVTYFIAPYDETVYPEYQAAVKAAKDAGLGIWDPEEPLMELPFEFRAMDDQKGFLRYVGNSDTMKYVLPDDWAEVPVEKRVFFASEEEAESYGYTRSDGEEPGEGNQPEEVEIIPLQLHVIATIWMRDLIGLKQDAHVVINISHKKKTSLLLLTKPQIDWLRMKNITLRVTDGTVSKTFHMRDITKPMMLISLD